MDGGQIPVVISLLIPLCSPLPFSIMQLLLPRSSSHEAQEAQSNLFLSLTFLLIPKKPQAERLLYCLRRIGEKRRGCQGLWSAVASSGDQQAPVNIGT